MLVTDAWRAYKTLCERKRIEHYRIKSDDGKHVIKGLYHIQNVNSFHSRMKKWHDRFKGVATKYLDNEKLQGWYNDKLDEFKNEQDLKKLIQEHLKSEESVNQFFQQ